MCHLLEKELSISSKLKNGRIQLDTQLETQKTFMRIHPI